MRNSTFLKVLLGVLALGLSYGAVFYGGVALGKTQAEPGQSSAAPVAAVPTPGAGMPETITFTAQDVAEMRANIEERFGGELPPGMQDMLDQVSDGGTIDFGALRRQRDGSGGGIAPGMFGGQ